MYVLQSKEDKQDLLITFSYSSAVAINHQRYGMYDTLTLSDFLILCKDKHLVEYVLDVVREKVIEAIEKQNKEEQDYANIFRKGNKGKP